MLCWEQAFLSSDWQNLICEEFEVWSLVAAAFEHETISVLDRVHALCVGVFSRVCVVSIETDFADHHHEAK